MTEQDDSSAGDADRDDLADLIASAQESAENGESPAHVRIGLIQNGVDGDAADAIVDRVFADRDTPLSERHREVAAASVSNSWMFWIGGLILINVCSWIFDWPFWLY